MDCKSSSQAQRGEALAGPLPAELGRLPRAAGLAAGGDATRPMGGLMVVLCCLTNKMVILMGLYYWVLMDFNGFMGVFYRFTMV